MTTTVKTPDVVGTAEAADILETIIQSISRNYKAGKMPRPAVELAATPVWHTSDIERLARGDNGRSRKGPLDLVGTKEASKILDVDKSQVGRWRRAGKFPKPCKELAAGPMWWREQIDEFAHARA